MKKTGLKRYTPLRSTGFKKLSYEEAYRKARLMKEKKARTPLKTVVWKGTPYEYYESKMKTLASRKTSKNGSRTRVDPDKVSSKGYKTPAWFNSIKPGAHGNSSAQKKYWKLVSIAVRVEDFETYGGKCVSCNTRLERWQDGQCAHFRAWSVCHGFFKFERTNLALSCVGCNRLNDGVIGTRFAEELERRYGKGHVDWIEQENEKHRGEKMEVWQIVERAEPLYQKYGHLL